jgi:N-acetylmuramoyl-L-alanine amidase
MTIIEHPSPNHSARRPGVRVDTVLLHHTATATDEAALTWMCERKSKVSAHYVVGVSGRVYRLVPESRTAWHAGLGRLPWEEVRPYDFNHRSIGVELVNPGDGVTPFAEAQYRALSELLPDIVRRLGTHASIWPLGDVMTARRVRQPNPGEEQGTVYILGHRDVAPGRKTDPADNFDWSRVREALQGRAT